MKQDPSDIPDTSGDGSGQDNSAGIPYSAGPAPAPHKKKGWIAVIFVALVLLVVLIASG